MPVASRPMVKVGNILFSQATIKRHAEWIVSPIYSGKWEPAVLDEQVRWNQTWPRQGSMSLFCSRNNFFNYDCCFVKPSFARQPFCPKASNLIWHLPKMGGSAFSTDTQVLDRGVIGRVHGIVSELTNSRFLCRAHKWLLGLKIPMGHSGWMHKFVPFCFDCLEPCFCRMCSY